MRDLYSVRVSCPRAVGRVASHAIHGISGFVLLFQLVFGIRSLVQFIMHKRGRA